jgi:hypothetical protein
MKKKIRIYRFKVWNTRKEREMIEVGEYVRTKDGIIAKVTYVDGLMIDCDEDVFDLKNLAMMEIPIEYAEEYIIKHSFNIIDLIEEGDYVNGYKVKEINKKRIGFQSSHNSISYEYWEDNYDIKSIVTKEQFASMKYKVKE